MRNPTRPDTPSDLRFYARPAHASHAGPASPVDDVVGTAVSAGQGACTGGGPPR